MGIYREDSETIKCVLEEALNNLDGDVYKDDFLKACKKLYEEYEAFS